MITENGDLPARSRSGEGRERRWRLFQPTPLPGLPSGFYISILFLPMGSELNSSASDHSNTSPLGGVLSAILPGLGLLVRGYPVQMIWVLIVGGLLGVVTWALGAVGGPGAGLFFSMLIILPWWCLQAYQAYLPAPQGQLATLRHAWKRGHDIRFLGGLFLWTALMDLYIIVANPEYHLSVFCTKPTGILGLLFKVQSPTLHVAIGYGFLKLRRWALFVYLAYAGFGILNATSNFACFGYGRIRTVFFISLLAFTAYVIWRRDCLVTRSRRS
ncbi:hypothetical protein [Candidatus Nitrospira neomarina]|uniref:Uncharacterized protein n=1 Tax=Candidatus Nitrospira neomarina TaxID=3020899 RepID=A0AA96JVD7_9BACT|nr:hypothetical protein [Candidatus Nitrospira neomarina]WNM60900.1 hypothetical protein PQG83_14185 [Candidatus Nitrospira neomarina]